MADSAPAIKRVNRVNPIKRRQMEERCVELEEEIPRLEAAMRTAEQGMATFVSAEQTQMLLRQLDQLRLDHAAALEAWESLMLQLEEPAPLS